MGDDPGGERRDGEDHQPLAPYFVVQPDPAEDYGRTWPIGWVREPDDDVRPRCARCKRKDTLKVWHCQIIRARDNPWQDDAPPEGTPLWWLARIMCFDSAACEARIQKKWDRSRVRSTSLFLREPKAPHAPEGTCKWCGSKVAVKAGCHPSSRRRSYHRGDEVEVGDGRNCLREYLANKGDARDVLWLRDQGMCNECGIECGGPGQPGWAADHVVPLEDGGEHALANLQTLCDGCHGLKTGEENRARAAARRGG